MIAPILNFKDYITEYILPLRLTASSRRNPTDWLNVPKSETRNEWIVLPSGQLKIRIHQDVSNQKCNDR